MNWQDDGYGGVRAVHDQGDFEGAIVTEAAVIHGGNKLWTPCVTQRIKGRKKKIGEGRVNSKPAMCQCFEQQRTREEAIDLCEKKWRELFHGAAKD